MEVRGEDRDYLDGRVNRKWLLKREGKPKGWRGMRGGENELNSRMSQTEQLERSMHGMVIWVEEYPGRYV